MKHLLPALVLVCTSVIVRAADTEWIQLSDLGGIVRSMTFLKIAAAEAGSPAASTPVLPLTPATSAFLESIGLDPASEDVRVAHGDGTISSIFRGNPISNSLESLAKQGSKKGVLSFVTTRVFIRKLKADFKGTSIPKTGYDGIYLTTEERGLVADKLVD